MNASYFFALVPLSLLSLPQSPRVIEGQAAFEQKNASLLEIIADDQSLIEWDDFSIGVSETARFVQPNEQAVVINQVALAYPSQIFGRLESNGQVVLVNPNGVLVGKDAVVDTGAFWASTLDLPSFKEGLVFGGRSKGTLRVEGSISGKRVVLVGLEIEQTGKLFGSENVMVCACGGASFSSVGAVRSLETDIGTASVQGSVLAFDGTIGIFGNQVRVEEGAVIDVSSSFSAGKIGIGGKDFAPADWIYIAEGANLFADAHESGNGGEMVLWSERGTIAQGALYARGGKSGGNGGFIEVSGNEGMHFNWNADLSAPNGTAGTLWFDPTNIVISSAGPFTAVNFAANPASWPALTNPVTINSANVAGGLSFFLNNSGSVVITTNVAPDPGAAGTITVNAGANVAWSSANSLTLTAQSDILVNANIQNGGTGDVTLRSINGNIFISNSANGQAVSVGTRAGTTRVTADGRTAPVPACNNCAALVNTPPFPANTACCTFCNAPVTGTGNICIQGANGASRIAQIGRNAAAAGELCPGPIVVACNNLSLQSGIANGPSAIIGHGGVNSSTNSGPITVTAAGTIFLNTPGPSSNATPVIGHATFNTSTDQSGAINVTAGQDLILKSSGNTTDACLIGHTDLFNDVGAFNVSGDITVNVGRDLWIDTSQNTSVIRMGIGHSFFPSQNLSGDIRVNVGRDLNMIGSSVGGVNTTTYIGLCSFPNGRGVTSNITVQACRDINLDPRLSTCFGIGAQSAVVAGSVITGNINVSAGGNINIAPSTGPGGTTLTTYIGYSATGGGVFTTSTNVTAGGNIAITCAGAGTRSAGIGGKGNVTVSAGGNITLNTSVIANCYIGTDDTSATPFTTTVRSGADIIAMNTAAAGSALFGRNPVNAAGPYSLDIRAAGDLQFASPYTVTGAATIFAEADAAFAAGQFGMVCGSSVPSAAIPSNNFGSVSVNKRTPATAALLFQSNTGKITIHSGQFSRAGTIQNLLVGTGAANQLQFTTNDSLEIAGSGTNIANPAVPSLNSFNDVTIATALTVGGSVYIRANNNTNVNAAVTSGAGQPLTLISDGDFSGTGNLALTANVASSNGNLLLQAGNPSGCSANASTSSVSQTAGQVNSGSGNLTVNANSDINLSSPAVPSMTTSTGNFHTLAGHDTNLTNTTISKTGGGGDLLMISGHNMKMVSSAISALPAIVTLVVDNCFPQPPQIGPGAFSMDSASSILSDSGQHLRIFTSLQSQNLILGTLNGTLFAPGTLFVDTASEHWCQYFEFPFPYPLFATLGTPFTVFYKPCLQQATQQAMVIVDQILIDLHPYNEFPGWKEEFFVSWVKPGNQRSTSSGDVLAPEPYLIFRRLFNILNQPKSWTQILPE